MKIYILLIAFPLMLGSVQPVKAQSEEIQQLILDIEKLNQLRAILNNMYKGYKILTSGYNTIKDLAEGNFNMHKLFLDGLLEVSPTVKKYKRIVEIISTQQQLVKEYKNALGQFRSTKVFNPDDIGYLETVYEKLIDRSLKNLEELLMVVTAGKLRMNDAERIDAIDRIYADMQDKLQFLRHFNDKATLMAVQKQRLLKETKDLKSIYGIK